MLSKYEIVSNPFEHLQHLQWNDSLAVAVSLENAKNDEIVSRLNIFCFNGPSRIYEYPLKILTKKHFKHMTKLNRFLEMTIESGLIVKWLKGFNFDLSEKEPLYQYAIVEMESFLMVVVITSCLHAVAFLLIYLERKTYMKIHRETVSRTWQIVDKTINPDRYFLMRTLYGGNTRKRN